MRWILGLAVAAMLLAAGCSPFGGGSFACAEDTECSGGSAAGVCEPTGFCSFADGSCTSGRRYGDLAGNGFAGVCVGEEPDDFDAAPVADADPNAPDAMPGTPDATPLAFCAPQTGLVSCWEFENNVLDSTGNNNATATNETYTSGVDGQALVHAANTVVSLPEDADFSVSAFTIEAWIFPQQLPGSGERMGILDNQDEYGFFLRPAGEISCSGGGSHQSTATVTMNQFNHVACTANGTTVTIYVNGVESGNGGGGGGISTGGTQGIRIGSDSPSGGDELIGRIDNLRFWNVVRTRAQICADNPGACP